MRRYRIISLIALITLAVSAAGYYVARSGSQFETRGTSSGFPQPINNAESLLIGVNVELEQYDGATLDARLADLAKRGVRYVRQEFRWSEIEATRGQMDWSTSDRIISATRRYQLQLLPVLVTTPEWARAPSAVEQNTAIDTSPPQAAGDFAWFAHQFALRYDVRLQNGQPSILAYQIWDEPNLSAKWGNGLISPVGYLRILWAARGAIQMVNPAARIVLAGLAPTVEQSDVNLAPEVFLTRLYQLGGHDAFDIVALKPYGFDYSPYDRRVDPALLTVSRALLVREVMAAHGEGNKAIWFTQWGWNAQLPDWKGAPSIWGGVSEAAQADYTAQFVQRAAQEWPWVGAMFAYTLQPKAEVTDPHWGFALLDQKGNSRPVYEALTHAVTVAATSPRGEWAAAGYGQSKYLGLGKTPDYGPNPLATYTEGWRFGELGADIPQTEGAHMTFHFGGEALALIARRGDYRAYLYITIDGKPANLLPREAGGSYLILTSPDSVPRIDTLEVANGLGPGDHVADITIDRGWNQWALVGWSSRPAVASTVLLANAIQPISAILALLSALALVITLPRARWGDALRRLWPSAGDLTWQAFLAALVLWVTTSLTWAQDAATAYQNLGAPVNLVLSGVVSGIAFWSPVFIVSLIALLVLFVLVLMRLDLGMALIAFFIPFYLVPQRLFAKSFPMVELLTAMCAVSWGIRRINEWRAQRLKRDKGIPALAMVAAFVAHFTVLDWGILALVIVTGLSTAQADFKVEALRELRMVIVEPAILFLMLRSQKLNRDAIWRLVDGFVSGAVIIALIGLANYARGNVFPAEGGLPRIRSIYGSPNNDALFLSRAFPLLLAITLFGRQSAREMTTTAQGFFGRLRNMRAVQLVTSRRLLYAGGLFAVSVAIVLSQSRGSLLFGLPAAVIAICVMGGGRWRYAGVALLVLLIVAMGILLSGVAAPLLANTRFASALALTSGTGFFRFNLWQSAIGMWRDHPLLGVGPDNFLYAYRGYYIQPAAWQEPNLSHPHNIVLDFATRLGALGLIAGAGIAIGIARALRRAWLNDAQGAFRPLVIGCAGVFAALLAHGMVDHSIFLVDLSFAFMLIVGIVSQAAGQPKTLTKL